MYKDLGKRNERLFLLNNVFHFSSVAMITGSVMQSFMVESGITEHQVTIYVSILQLVQALVLIFGSGLIDKSRNILRSYAVFELACLPLYIVAIAFCYLNDTPANIKYMVILIVGSFVGLTISLSALASYKVPYHIINMDSYGVVTAFAGAGTGICGMCVSGLMTLSLRNFEYYNVMTGVFFTAGGLMLTAAVMTLRLKEINSHSSDKEVSPHFNLFTYKPFYMLLLPNLFRGINAGIYSIAAMIGYYYEILDSTTAALLVILTNTASLVGCFSYGTLARGNTKREGIVVLVSSIGIALLMPSMLIGNSPVVFLIAFFLGYVCYEFINYAVPVLVTRMVVYEAIGRYTAWRIMIHTLGIAVTGFICIPLLNICSGYLVLTIAGLMQLTSGAAYYIIEKKGLYK